jgi:hypothetical protein
MVYYIITHIPGVARNAALRQIACEKADNF